MDFYHIYQLITCKIRKFCRLSECDPYGLNHGNYWNFYYISGIIWRLKIKKIDMIHLGFRLHTRNWKGRVIIIVTSRHINLVELCRMININISNNCWKCQIDNLIPSGYFAEMFVKYRSAKYRASYGRWTMSCDFHLIYWVMSFYLYIETDQVLIIFKTGISNF